MQARFTVTGLVEFQAALARLSARGIPGAARAGLNRTAFAARAEWQTRIGDAMTLRNAWTKRSIRVDRATGSSVERMAARVGSVADFMGLQESGGTITKKHKHGVAIPTSVASGEGRGSRRTKLVRRPNRLPAIQLLTRVGASRQQRNAIAIRQVIASGRKYVFLELERRAGIFRIAGGRRNPRLDMIWDLTRPAVRVPATGTLAATLKHIGPSLGRNLLDALKRAVQGRREGGAT